MSGVDSTSIRYYILGTGLLMPWNAFITAADYYSKQFPGKHVDRLITVSYLPINLAVLGLLLSRDSQRESSWSYLRIMIGFCMYSVTMFLVPLMDVLGIISLIPMLFLVFLSGAADGAAQGALFGYAALSGDSLNTQSLIVGTSTSGLIISILRLGTKASFAGERAIHISSNLYFIISGMICSLCICIFSTLRKKDGVLTQQGMEIALDSERHPDEWSQDTSLLKPEGLSSMNIQSCTETNPYGKIWRIFGKAWQPFVSNMTCYSVTLSIFPGVLAEDLDFSGNSWYPIILILIFNAADCVGKFCPHAIQSNFFSKSSVLSIALLRCCFIPLYLIALGSIPAISILTIFLGISNGALTTINMVYAIDLVDNSEHHLCGNLNVFFLVLGLNIGALSGFIWLL